MDEVIAFEQVIVAMAAADELLLAFMDGEIPGSPGVHRCVALLSCSRRVGERMLKELGSTLNEK